MNRSASTLTAFHLISDRSGLPAEETGRGPSRPVLFANYSDLSKLRYDFPLILVSDDQGHESMKSLADTIDDVLGQVAPPGIVGEEIRRQVLNLEQLIRNRVARGQTGVLSQLWDGAARKLVSEADDSSTGTLRDNLLKARRALGFDGEIVDCDTQLPARLIRHAWRRSQRVKTMQLRSRIERLVQKLSDILRVDYIRSPEARDAGHLKSLFGPGDQVVFDFHAMAHILKSAPVGQPLSKQRRRRIEEAVSVLESQSFVATEGAGAPFSFVFEDCSEALTAFRERLPEIAALVRAVSIAELEIENRYDESQHDSFYRHFDEDQLDPEDLALFPSYLVCLEDGDDAEAAEAMFKILRAGLPFKIVAQTKDIVGGPSIASGLLSFGTRGQHPATMAMGLNNVFVLQAAASSLYRLRERILHGLTSDQPALFSVYSGIYGGSFAAENSLPPYLLAAAATESRAFPCFVYDPASGNDLASRFHLDGNPLAEHDWCQHAFQYEDSEHNIHVEQTAFTLVDFIACDGRFADHFVRVPKTAWGNDMLPVDTFLDLDSKSRTGKVPYVLLIDEDDVLQRAVCDGRLIDAAKRCRELWRGLQELGGINNSHALKALTQAEEAWKKDKEQLIAAAVATTAVQEAAIPQPTPPAAAPAVEAPSSEVPDTSSDDPWIETIRCTTCNECTQLNDRMFAYDNDKRAFIADPDAGTYRELVEAAETCQVAIIHPGKPRKPDEPGLEELIERAEPFNT